MDPVVGEVVGKDVMACDGASVSFSLSYYYGYYTTIMVNDATVITPDIVASNGVIHVIDTVLLPPGFSIPGAPMPPAQPVPPYHGPGYGPGYYYGYPGYGYGYGYPGYGKCSKALRENVAEKYLSLTKFVCDFL